jgi:hypothetical protein
MTNNNRRQITRNDILDLEIYAQNRRQRRRELIAYKKPRRIAVGPDATFYFENYETMWAQVQEMLWIEKGGEAQIGDELAAYNPLIPNGRELVATFMIEIDDPDRRLRVLNELTGVEHCIQLQFAGETIAGEPELSDNVERTKDDGKTSSIHFLRFKFSVAQVAKFLAPNPAPQLMITHPAYGHIALLGADSGAALAGDFDPVKE